MNLYEEILLQSKPVDERWSQVPSSEARLVEHISFPVPQSHVRYTEIKGYSMTVESLQAFSFLDEDVLLIDEGIQELVENIQVSGNRFVVKPEEGVLKTRQYLDDFIEQTKIKGKRLIAIGGGIILNTAAYIAEQCAMDLILVPTSIISMSDSCIGGKVRVNEIQNGAFSKHAYKSFYEPSYIILDPTFLQSLPETHIRIGLAEIIKHAIYQSEALGSFLLSNEFEPFKNRESLLKAILWTADLKRVCIEADPEEAPGGARTILRAAHEISDKLEEASGLTMSHGEAVLRAMLIDETDEAKKQKDLLGALYTKLGISFS